MHSLSTRETRTLLQKSSSFSMESTSRWWNGYWSVVPSVSIIVVATLTHPYNQLLSQKSLNKKEKGYLYFRIQENNLGTLLLMTFLLIIGCYHWDSRHFLLNSTNLNYFSQDFFFGSLGVKLICYLWTGRKIDPLANGLTCGPVGWPIHQVRPVGQQVDPLAKNPDPLSNGSTCCPTTYSWGGYNIINVPRSSWHSYRDYIRWSPVHTCQCLHVAHYMVMRHWL